MNKIEIEVQVKIERPKVLLNFLKTNGKFVGEQHQIDQYFSPQHRDFLAVKPVKEWFRLRDSGKRCSVNYKNWHYNKSGKSLFCEEFESYIDDIEALRNMLKALNYQRIATVDKTRKTWNYKEYEIAIDLVKTLGDFVEIEWIGDKRADPEDVVSGMVKFLKDLKVGKIERNHVGYPFQILFKDKVEFEVL